MIDHAPPTLSSAAASLHAAATPALEPLEARQQRDALKALLRKEQAAMSEFLIALADFDRRRGWEALGHASLFAFITSELGLSPAPTYWRQEAARLLRRFSDLAGPLRRGELCLTTMAELAKVLTKENQEVVLPRFLGISSREAKEIVAELQPREAPATRTVVTRVQRAVLSQIIGPVDGSGQGAGGTAGTDAAHGATSPVHRPQVATSLPFTPAGAPPSQLWAPKVDFGGEVRCDAPRNGTEPLTADLRRLHITVSRQLLKKLEAARDGLSHAVPGASAEQVIEAALDLLLEKQARSRGQVKRPRSVSPLPTEAAAPTANSMPPPRATPVSNPAGSALAPATTEPTHRRTGPREAIPAAVRRAVWERDQGRCTWPIDGGGRCGSTHRLELDHIQPWARDGQPTVANLRVVCHAHNARAARQVFGARCVERYAGRRQEAS
jgi:hypothetical protein